MSACHNNPEKSTTEINKHTSSDHSSLADFSFDATKSKIDYYRGKCCMKAFCKDLRKNAKNNLLWKKRNDTINKWRKGSTSWAKSLLYM